MAFQTDPDPFWLRLCRSGSSVVKHGTPLFCCQNSSSMGKLGTHVLTSKDSRKGRQIFWPIGGQRGRGADQRAGPGQTEQGLGQTGAQGRDVILAAKGQGDYQR